MAATPGLGPKLAFLRETAFPPAAYMRAQFGRTEAREGLAAFAEKRRPAWAQES